MTSASTNHELVLIHPGTGTVATTAGTLAGSEHLGLSYLASAAEAQGIRTRILDLQGMSAEVSSVMATIKAAQPLAIGISPTSKSAPQAIGLTKLLHTHFPNTPIIWGGHLASGLGVGLFSICNEVDAVVLHDGEQLISAVVRHAAQGELPRHPAILANPSSCFAQVEQPPIQDETDWRLLFPSRQQTAEHYKSNGVRILTSRGCGFDCTFCTTPAFYGRHVIEREAAHVALEASRLSEAYGVSRFWVNDDVFCDGSAASQRRALEIATLLQDSAPGARFRAMLRADFIWRAPEVLKALQAKGLESVFVGLESGTAGELSLYRKRVTISQNRAVPEILRSLGLFLQIGFIMFSPNATVTSIRENTRFLAAIGQLYRFMPLSRTMQIFPGTSLWDSSPPFDVERSTDFARIPQFRDPSVRALSMAFERLEEEFGASDRDAYSRAYYGSLGPSEMGARTEMLTAFVDRACVLAARGCSEEDIVNLGRETIQTLRGI